jgi:hypothetical protein
MDRTAVETCPDCKATLPAGPCSAHPYFGASPSCWALYGEVLAREYASQELMQVHRLTVDAYAAQHPGQPGRQSAQSVWLHLAGLHLILDRKLSHDFGRRVIGSLARSHELRGWLEPPENLGSFTVVQVFQAVGLDGHRAAILRWAESVWSAWQPHHQTIARVADRAAARL